MFESFKRFGKFLKYGLQSLMGVVLIVTIFIDMNSEITALAILAGLFLMAVIETLARGIVWIISGYFETNTDINPARLRQMREYYTCYRLRNKLSKLLKKI